jgi:DNA-directed DNA polymerase III PolC
MQDNTAMKPFCHLHNHSYYSILDGLSSPKQMVDAAVKNGYKSLAITDHGSCGGWYDFQKACKVAGIKPILGNEVYFCPDHTDRDPQAPRYHLVLLAKNYQGVRNLMKLSTLSETVGKYRKPRIDFELLKKYHEGIICLTGCCIGELCTKLWQEDDKGALDYANKYKELFGDDFYIEIMMHKYKEGSKDQEIRERKLAKKLFQLAKKLEIKCVCTNDSHYANECDAKYHDVMLSMQTHDHIKNPDRFTFNGDQFYIRPYEEMYALYESAPEMLTNTLEIAEKIEDDAILIASKDLLPHFQIPQGFDSEEKYLKALVKDGMKSKSLLDKTIYRERIKMEMDLIINCGFVRYFLTLWDIINFANQQGVRTGVGRGSGAGSLCLYVLGITKLDPIEHGLLFERFINPERVSPPDVDIDFDYYRRDEIFDYITRKYGADYCCKIGTYNTFKARAAIRYAAKALDIGNDWEAYQAAKRRNPNAKVEMTKKSLDLADFIAKQIPEGPGVSIESALKDDEAFRRAMLKYPTLLDITRHVENTVSSAGVHPAGIIICKDPVVDHIPLRESKGAICSQFTMEEVEELGLLKFDMLALKTLTVVENTIQMIKERYGTEIKVDDLTPNDPHVLKLFNSGHKNMDNRGIFQFEAHGISKLLRDINVDSFTDLVVCNALYRPGPLGAGVHQLYSDYKHGRKKIEYLHPKMGEVLDETYGIMVFQEHIMKVVQVLAGFTLGQADWLRKVVGKKKPELIKKEKLDELFINGCKENSNIDEKTAKKIFEQIEYFGGYGFNKCLSGDTTVINEKDGKVYRLDELEEQFFNAQGWKEFGVGEECKKTEIVLKSYKDGDIVEDEVVDVFEVGTRKLFEVELDNDVIIKCTMDHKFICSDSKAHTLRDIVNDDLEILYEYEKELKGYCNRLDMKKCKVKSIKYLGKQKVYSLTMRSEQHNYFVYDKNVNVFIPSLNSHSAAYAMLAYQTAWLKVYYPLEFMCNLLSSEINSNDKGKKLDSYISEAKRMGLIVKGADINRSGLKYSIASFRDELTGKERDGIRTPLTVVKGVGEKAVQSIVDNQPFADLKDFLHNVDTRKVHSKVFNALVEADCMHESWKLSKETLASKYTEVKNQVDKENKQKRKQKERMEQYGGESIFSKLGGKDIKI